MGLQNAVDLHVETEQRENRVLYHLDVFLQSWSKAALVKVCNRIWTVFSSGVDRNVVIVVKIDPSIEFAKQFTIKNVVVLRDSV